MTLGLEGRGKWIFIIGDLAIFAMATAFAIIILFVSDYYLAVGIFACVTILITASLIFGMLL